MLIGALDLYWFGGVSLTAGFCEEFLYRGYFVWVFSPWLGWWGAAALSLPFFAVAHVYQGWNGVLRTGMVGAFLTLVVAILGSSGQRSRYTPLSTSALG